MNTPNEPQKTNHNNDTFIAIVLSISSSNIFTDEMHGQPLWLRVIVAAATGAGVALLALWCIKRLRRS